MAAHVEAPVTGARKRRWVIALQRWFLNPQMRPMVWLGVIPGHVIVETTGRRTGKIRRTVVGSQREGDTIWVIAEHGRHAGWVCNVDADEQIRVRHRGRWHDARATILDDDDALGRLRSWGRVGHGALVRALGTDWTTVRIELAPSSASNET